jgi:hypothetical protein
MRTKLIIVALLAVIAFFAWRLVRQVGGAHAGPINMEQALGARLMAELGRTPVTRVLVVGYEIQNGIPDFSVRLDGLRREARRQGLSDEQVAFERWVVDPMDVQNGKPGFTLAQLGGLLQKHPGTDGVILMLDLAYPSDADRQALASSRPRICLLAVGEGAARLHKDKVVNTLFIYRTGTTAGPPPAPSEDRATAAIEKAYVILRDS